MHLRYTNHLGKQDEFRLGEEPVVIGRATDAQIVLMGEKVSRKHAAIRCWDGDYIIKDLKSRNGTFVNDQRVEVSKLEPGDRIRIGEYDVYFEEVAPKAPNTIIRRINEEMAEGNKGYSTMLRAIVHDAETHREKGTPEHS